MARYCFYCGRELSVGERCHCKNPAKEGKYQSTGPADKKESAKSPNGSTSYSYQTAAAGAGTHAGTGTASGAHPGTGAAAGAHAGTGAAAGAHAGTGAGAGSRTNPDFGSGAASGRGNASSRTRHARPLWNKKSSRSAKGFMEKAAGIQQLFFRLRTFSDQVRTLFPNITKSLASGVQFITRPASKIRQESMRVKLPYCYANIIMFSLLSGLLALLMSRSGSPLFTNLVSLAFGTGQSVLFSHPVISFFGLSILSCLFILTMGASFYVAARFSNRKPSYRKVLDLISISLVYIIIMEVFLLITILMGSRGSMSLLFVSLLLMGVTHLLAFRNALGLPEDTVFFFLIFVYIFCYILFQFLLYLAAQLLIYL